MTASRRVAVLKGGRSLERSVSLRSGAQVQDGLQRLGHEVVAIDVGPRLVPELLEPRRRTLRSSRCTAATARTGPCRRCSRRSACRTRARRRRRARAAPNKVLAKQLMREAGIPTPDFHPLRETSIKELGAAAALAEHGSRARLPARRQARERRLGAGGQVRRRERGAARRRSSARSPTTARSCSSATSRAGIWRSRCSSSSDATAGAARRPRRSRCRSSRRYRASEDFYDYESRYEIGMTTFVCPAELRAGDDARAPRSSRSASTGCSAATASRAST